MWLGEGSGAKGQRWKRPAGRAGAEGVGRGEGRPEGQREPRAGVGAGSGVWEEFVLKRGRGGSTLSNPPAAFAWT